jgi:biopolymer transport protein ExbB/TolQ
MTTDSLLLAISVEDILFDVAEALRVPVLVLALAAGVVVLIEVGALLMELRRRRRRGLPRLEKALDVARAALAKGDRDGALRAIRSLGFNKAMADTLGAIVQQGGRSDSGDRIAKRMAEYDYHSMKRLERTRILVRAGPALGLMGTLIPLSPALAALADGDISRLSRELRVAFSVTVAGLLVGMVAFAISLIRDRLYAQDYSDVEYVASALDGDVPAPSQSNSAAGATAGADQAQKAVSGAPAPATAVTTVMPATSAPPTPPPSGGGSPPAPGGSAPSGQA